MTMDHDALVDFLRDRSVLRAFPVDALRALAYVLRRVALDDGDVVFEQGDVGSEAFVVLEGEVEIGARLDDGREVARAVLRPGELFGELAIFGDGRRAATATARGSTLLGALDKDRFVAVIRAWPEAALALLRLATERFLTVERDVREGLAKR